MADTFRIVPYKVRSAGTDVPPEEIQTAVNNLARDVAVALNSVASDPTGPAGGDGNGYIHTIDQNASIGYTWAISSTSIFEARFGFTHVLAGKEPPYLGDDPVSASSG